jgi:hypothetical protein
MSFSKIRPVAIILLVTGISVIFASIIIVGRLLDPEGRLYLLLENKTGSSVELVASINNVSRKLRLEPMTCMIWQPPCHRCSTIDMVVAWGDAAQRQRADAYIVTTGLDDHLVVFQIPAGTTSKEQGSFGTEALKARAQTDGCSLLVYY